MSKFGLDKPFDPINHQQHLDILSRGGPQADELIEEIKIFVSPMLWVNYMYPHTMKPLPVNEP